MREVSVLARKLGASPLFARFLTREEIRSGPDRGFDLIGQVAAETNTPLIDLGPRFAAAIRAGQDPYRTGDDTHPNELGQRLMCEAIAPAVMPLLAEVPVRGLSLAAAAAAVTPAVALAS
jgi:lysophospholipase L1-like esterase